MKRMLLPLVFLLVGGILASIGWSQYQDHESLATDGRQVTGTVIDVKTSTDSEGDTTYAPVYGYEWEGEQRRYTPGSTSSSYPTQGETATLFVDPDDPGRVMADTFMDRWFIPVLLGGLGAVFLAVGLVIALASRRARRGEHAWEQPVVVAPATSTAAAQTAAPKVDARSNRNGPFVGSSQKSDPRGPFL